MIDMLFILVVPLTPDRDNTHYYESAWPSSGWNFFSVPGTVGPILQLWRTMFHAGRFSPWLTIQVGLQAGENLCMKSNLILFTGHWRSTNWQVLFDATDFGCGHVSTQRRPPSLEYKIIIHHDTHRSLFRHSHLENFTWYSGIRRYGFFANEDAEQRTTKHPRCFTKTASKPILHSGSTDRWTVKPRV